MKDTFTKLANPATLPTNQGTGCILSAGGNYLTVVHGASPIITIYKINDSTYEKIPIPRRTFRRWLGDLIVRAGEAYKAWN
jgi:hypothetical protein